MLGVLDRQDMHYAPANRLQGRQMLPDTQANASACKCVMAYAGRHTHTPAHRLQVGTQTYIVSGEGHIYTDSYKGDICQKCLYNRLFYCLLWGFLNPQCQSVFAD